MLSVLFHSALILCDKKVCNKKKLETEFGDWNFPKFGNLNINKNKKKNKKRHKHGKITP